MILPWAPTIDGTFLPYQPVDILRNQSYHLFNQVPTLWGSNLNETDAFLPLTIPYKGLNVTWSEAVYYVFLDSIFGKSIQTEITKVYPPVGGFWSGNESRVPADEAMTDYLFICATRMATRVLSTKVPSYTYTWTRPTINNTDKACINASCHTCELPYVWHTLVGDVNHPAPIPIQDIELSLAATAYWAAFINGSMLQATPKSSSNNDKKKQQGGGLGPLFLQQKAARSSSLQNDGYPVWPKWNNVTKMSMILNIPLINVSAYRGNYCDFWDTLGYYW